MTGSEAAAIRFVLRVLGDPPITGVKISLQFSPPTVKTRIQSARKDDVFESHLEGNIQEEHVHPNDGVELAESAVAISHRGTAIKVPILKKGVDPPVLFQFSAYCFVCYAIVALSFQLRMWGKDSWNEMTLRDARMKPAATEINRARPFLCCAFYMRPSLNQSLSPIWFPETAGILLPHDVVKVNSNGAVFRDQQAVGIGVIARDHAGRFLLGLLKRFEGIRCPTTAQIFAARGAIIFSKMFTACAMVEGDASRIIKLTIEDMRAALRTIVNDHHLLK
ncbi:hypothetical protein ACH5RR_034281 [Cinchona calisaya]|uniref:RNase H type-1 domain-containing protein n=1 Tax=Cinchona calisaya TaxID=153742 RepID=A0ABD2YB75_9GENT